MDVVSGSLLDVHEGLPGFYEKSFDKILYRVNKLGHIAYSIECKGAGLIWVGSERKSFMELGEERRFRWELCVGAEGAVVCVDCVEDQIVDLVDVCEREAVDVSRGKPP